MRLLINKKYSEVGFWSFMKCWFLVQLALTGMIYGLFLLLFALAV